MRQFLDRNPALWATLLGLAVTIFSVLLHLSTPMWSDEPMWGNVGMIYALSGAVVLGMYTGLAIYLTETVAFFKKPLVHAALITILVTIVVPFALSTRVSYLLQASYIEIGFIIMLGIPVGVLVFFSQKRENKWAEKDRQYAELRERDERTR